MQSCLFCKIIKGELPSYKIYEDETYFGFLDIHPRVKGHTLLVPKKHYEWVYDVPNFGQYWEIALKITKALKTTLHPHFVSYVTHGLEVQHAHIHIMPRPRGETSFVPEIKQFSREEFEEVAKKVRSLLESSDLQNI